MNTQASMTLPARIESIRPLREMLRETAAGLFPNSSDLGMAEMALEEVLTNIVDHAYARESGRNEPGDMKVEVRAEHTSEAAQLVITITDQGRAFDPLAAPEPVLGDSVEDVAVGGLGIHLVRKTMHQVRYTREDDCNVLTMIYRPRHS